MAYVRAAAAAPSPTCRDPLSSALRPVNSDSDAPTPKSASPLIAALMTTYAVETSSAAGANRNGTTGTTAPAANARNDPIAAPHGDPSDSGSFLAFAAGAVVPV